MSRPPIEKLLGTDDRDPGCEGAFEVLDLYVEAVRRGEDPRQRYADFVAHIRNCAACREDTEGLLAALALLEEPPLPPGKIPPDPATNSAGSVYPPSIPSRSDALFRYPPRSVTTESLK